MKCPKCKDEYNDDVDICADCLVELVPDDYNIEQIEPVDSGQVSYEEEMQGVTIFDEIKSHLDFLGFKMKEDNDSLIITHPNLPYEINMTEFESGYIFEVNFKISDKAKNNTLEYLLFINQCNNDVPVCRVLNNQESGFMIIDSWFPGNYEKVIFEIFIKTILSEINLIINREDFKEWVI